MLRLRCLVTQMRCLLFFLVGVQVTVSLGAFSPPENPADLQDYLKNLGTKDVSAFVGSLSNQASCALACGVLNALLQDAVYYPPSSGYMQQQAGYWSLRQAETHPACRAAPKSAKEVAIAYLAAATFRCNFAVKGGGHAAFAGASSINNGLTIDLKNLNTMTVNSDKNVTAIGTGNRWIDVYEYLTPQNLSVVGGRVSDIGVSGLTLGGGISYFSGRRGWACDNIVNYEIVLADGQIHNANVNTNSDLYWALRGGGNNFGIVTRMDLETFPQGNLLGGQTIYPGSANASLFAAYQDFVSEVSQDPDAALILAFAYAQGAWVASNNYEYTRPIEDPAIFRSFFDVPSLSSTQRITNLTDLTIELTRVNPQGFRQTYITATFQNDADIQKQIFDIFIEEMDPIEDINGSLPAIVFQPIVQSTIAQFSKNGGNALGLADAKGPLMLINVAVAWSNAADDARVLAATSNVIGRSVAAAKEKGVDNKYIYQNYAAKGQDVFEGYGEESRNRLIQISEKYDPKGIFQRLQPGYFKLGRF